VLGFCGGWCCVWCWGGGDVVGVLGVCGWWWLGGWCGEVVVDMVWCVVVVVVRLGGGGCGVWVCVV
jgi:hypothetical protein